MLELNYTVKDKIWNNVLQQIDINQIFLILLLMF